MADLTKLHFLSSENYLKSSTFCGSTTLTLSAGGSSVTYTITHNLGYIPFFEVYGELDSAGTIWSGGKVSANTDQNMLSGSGVSETYPQLDAWSDTISLTITLTNNTSPVATGDRVVYWIIYKDYGNV